MNKNITHKKYIFIFINLNSKNILRRTCELARLLKIKIKNICKKHVFLIFNKSESTLNPISMKLQHTFSR